MAKAQSISFEAGLVECVDKDWEATVRRYVEDESYAWARGHKTHHNKRAISLAPYEENASSADDGLILSAEEDDSGSDEWISSRLTPINKMPSRGTRHVVGDSATSRSVPKSPFTIIPCLTQSRMRQ